ncbi:chitin elicitor-binding protein-like [Triticum dicoccoides]|uniref:chitin elicitor-binding protein-like n=1 Tax=Triticum dicoccoides TaxID=85692 RepID=UPI00188E85BC|nr:chitin elicitor-binding protein-like [Triticum dicoccoides]
MRKGRASPACLPATVTGGKCSGRWTRAHGAHCYKRRAGSPTAHLAPACRRAGALPHATGSPPPPHRSPPPPLPPRHCASPTFKQPNQTKATHAAPCCSTVPPPTQSHSPTIPQPPAEPAPLAATPAMAPACSLPALLLLTLAVLSPTPAAAARFACNATAPRASTCQALVSYSPPNATTLAAVRALFQLRSHRALLASNDLPLSTPTTAPAPFPVRVRLPCLCSGGAGATFQRPTYKVRAGDTLDAVARGAFAGLVTYRDIAAANNISDPNRVAVGQELWVPLPCSCDPVGGEPVVHLTYVAPAGSSVAGIAEEYGTTEETILALNRMPDAKSLLAGQVLDVPLRACSSAISNSAIDRNLRVPNASYILTANNCIMCGCSSTSWQLDCQPTQGLTPSCPAAKCGDLFLGNTSTSATSACQSTTCSYAGYTNGTSFTILANLTTSSVCNAAGISPAAQPAHSSASRLGSPARWSELIVGLHVALLCLGFLRRD